MVGDPADAATEIGPLAREDLRENLDRQVQDSVARGARVLCGGANNPTTVEDAPMLAERYDNISSIVYDGVGHSAFFEQPDQFNADLREFAAGPATQNVSQAIAP